MIFSSTFETQSLAIIARRAQYTSTKLWQKCSAEERKHSDSYFIFYFKTYSKKLNRQNSGTLPQVMPKRNQ